MLLSERRKRYRQVLEGNVCVHPASVFDAMSARMAQSLGFEVGMFAGSIGSGTVLGAPDLVVGRARVHAQNVVVGGHRRASASAVAAARMAS